MSRPTVRTDSLPWLIGLWFTLVLLLLARPPLLLFWHYTLHPQSEKETGRVAEPMRLPNLPQSLGETWSAGPVRTAEVAAQLSPLEQGIFDATNREREQLGRPKMWSNTELAEVAVYYSRHMRDGVFFAHVAVDGTGPADRVGKALRRTFGMVTENIAKLTDRDGLVGEFVEGWMNSPGHRHNLLDGSSSDLGVGCAEPAKSDTQAWFHCTQVFMAVWANLRQAIPDKVAEGQALGIEITSENGKPVPAKLRQTDVRTSAVVAWADLHRQNGGAKGQWLAQGPAGVYRLELEVPDTDTPGRFLIVPGPYVTVGP